MGLHMSDLIMLACESGDKLRREKSNGVVRFATFSLRLGNHQSDSRSDSSKTLLD